MKRSSRTIAALAAFLFGTLCAYVRASEPSATSASGIALDTPWKVSVYALARKTFVHPAWGWQHSERNYAVSLGLAKADHLTVDTDVLFAAAFLHDMAAFAPFQKEGVEHGDVAAKASESVLRDAGFPMVKFPAVAAAERGHMFYSDAGSRPEAIVLHDADSLDFLGAMGAARLLALVGEKAPSVDKTVAELRSFAHDIPPKLLTKSGRALGVTRALELTAFLDRFEAENSGDIAR